MIKCYILLLLGFATQDRGYSITRIVNSNIKNKLDHMTRAIRMNADMYTYNSY